jgi:hypothetical protein
MKKPPSSHFILLFTLFIASHHAANAAATGSISGVVSNIASGAFLQDARVEIPDKNILAYTDELGRFSVRDLEPGEYNLQVYYTGLMTHRQSVAVTAGQTAAVTVGLDAEIYKLEAYVVSGEREGNAAAITRQRTAPNIKNVVSLDAFGNLANDNAGELLIRLPGIIGNIADEGNIDNVGVRGATAGMTVVSVDGNQMSSTGGFGRNFRTNVMSAAFFNEIEVTKALTPDMPGDSLGGAINMKTGSMLRHKSRRIEYRLTGRWAAPFYNSIPMLEKHPVHALASVKYQDIFSIFGGGNNLGIGLNMFYNENASGYYKSQLVYQYARDDPAYVWDYSVADNYTNRKQASANLRVDYKVSPSMVIYLGMLYNDDFQPNTQRLTAQSYNSNALATWNDDGQK